MDTRSGNRTFESFEPTIDWSRAADADAVKISLPGFKREEIRVLVDNHGRLRTHGERLLYGTRWSRFRMDFQLPDNCYVDGIRAKFEAETLTITLPKKTPSPAQAPPEPTRPVPALPQRPPPALPEQAEPAPPPVPVPPQVVPDPSQRQPAERAPSLPRKPPAPEPVPPQVVPDPSQRQPAERAPSLPRKPPAPEPVPARLPSVPAPAPQVVEPPKQYSGTGATTNPLPPAPAAPEQVTKTAAAAEEEARRMAWEAMGKMEEDRKAMQEKAKEEAAAAAAMGEMEMARQPRPASASRGLLTNVVLAAVVLLGITVYVWHVLSNAAGVARGKMGAGCYRDEM